MKLLMHTCCAPCSVYCIDSLRNEGIEPTIYWYNPNIHPYMEYKARRDTLKEYTDSIGVNAIFQEDYGLREFCKNVVEDLDNRCANYCYKIRLEETAKYAKENGYDTITTTLLVSPYQNHELIKELGEKIAEEYGLTFLYRDFRVGFRQGQAKARELGLYMQKYCGCVFSEEEKYLCHSKKKGILQSKRSENMNILFLGGDKRYLPIILELSKKNNIDLVGYDLVDIIGNKISNNSIEFFKYDVIILPMSGIKENMKVSSLCGDIEIRNDELKNISSKCVIFTGLITKIILEMNTKNVISFLEDKEIKDFNNDITVDGIIDRIKEKRKKKICILGYGNIGQKLHEKLNQEEIDIVIGEIEQTKLKLDLKIFDTNNTSEFINQIINTDIIINTVPSNILSEHIVKNISEETYILDVASYPHGIDKCLLNKYDLKYDLYLGIPGKYKPEESAKILIKKIKDKMGEQI